LLAIVSSSPAAYPTVSLTALGSGHQIEPACRQFHFTAVFSGEHRHHFLSEDLHLLLDLLGMEAAELDPKRLQLLHEIAPSVARAAFLVNANLIPGLQGRFAGAEAAAKSLGITLRRVDAASPADLEAAFSGIEASSSEALLIQSDPMLTGTEFSRILEFALAKRLPTVIEAHPASTPFGVLLSYGPQLLENARLAAGYVAKILSRRSRNQTGDWARMRLGRAGNFG
jgi:hypothetical protein